MIDKHATSLETQQALVTFVDKPMVVRWRHSWCKFVPCAIIIMLRIIVLKNNFLILYDKSGRLSSTSIGNSKYIIWINYILVMVSGMVGMVLSIVFP